MTTTQEVSDVLESMKESELAQQWLHNDIVKMRIAIHYDDWITDLDDHKLNLSLTEYIETCLDNPNLIGIY